MDKIEKTMGEKISNLHTWVVSMVVLLSGFGLFTNGLSGADIGLNRTTQLIMGYCGMVVSYRLLTLMYPKD